MRCWGRRSAIAGAFFLLSGCGLYTPVKDISHSESFSADVPQSDEALYEKTIVEHVQCELADGLRDSQHWQLAWLNHWGVTVTWSITAEDQSGVAPGLTLVSPMQNVVYSFPTGGNVTSPQSFSFSAGATASANGLRTEMIQFTVKNKDLLKIKADCERFKRGNMIDGDLRIKEFIYDKATLAASNDINISTTAKTDPPYNTWTEEITFVAALGATATPTWKLARLTANTSSNLVVAERTTTNDLVITVGPLDSPPKPYQSMQLIQSAMNQHNARVSASAIAVSVSGQSH